MVETTQEGLVRIIRRWDLGAVVLNATIGAGIFGLPSAVFALVGVYSLFAFITCAILVTLIILCFAEVSSRYTQTGGPYLYAREAFGPVVGFEVGWLMWIARVTAFAANCNLLLAYFGFFVPSVETGATRVATITIIVAALTAINIIGVRDATMLTNGLTIAKLLPLTLFIGVGFFFIEGGSYALSSRPAFGDFSVSVLLLVYAFTGFETAVIPAGEARDPKRDLPWALLSAIALVTVFYVLIQFIAIGTLPDLAGSTRPLADAGGRFLGPMGAAIISAGALVSILGNLNVTLMVTPRLPFAMAERGELPEIIGAVHTRFHTPHIAIYFTGFIVLVLTLTGTFVYAANDQRHRTIAGLRIHMCGAPPAPPAPRCTSGDVRCTSGDRGFGRLSSADRVAFDEHDCGAGPRCRNSGGHRSPDLLRLDPWGHSQTGERWIGTVGAAMPRH